MNGSKEKDNIKEKSFILYFQMGDNLTRKSVWFLLTLVLLTCHWKFVTGELAGDDIVLGKQRVFSFEYFLNALLMGILFFGLFVRQFVCLFVRVVHSCTMNTFFFLFSAHLSQSSNLNMSLIVVIAIAMITQLQFLHFVVY